MNVGSNPTSPKIKIFENSTTNSLKQPMQLINKINYNFFFISIIPPFFNKNLNTSKLFKNKNKKILVKQSYMLLVWFYYISYLKKKQKDDYQIKLASLPFKQRNFTLTKAPIAHKTRSKEQYTYGFYSYKISFTSFLKNNFKYKPSINASLLLLFLNRKYLPFFETNVFFLKYIKFNSYTSDSNFFNYYKFEKLYY